MTTGREVRNPMWWGTAASAVQTEGASPADNWHAWERAGRAPASGNGNGFAERFREDLELLADWGFSDHRLSVSWARVMSRPGEVDEDAVRHYLAVLSAGRAAGLRMWVTLLHTVIPEWFAAEGGFAGPTAMERWTEWVRLALHRFGGEVGGWMPINNPTSEAQKAYLAGTFPPGQQSPQAFAAVLGTLHRADFVAAAILRESGKPLCTNESIAPLYPVDDSERSAAAVAQLDALVWGSWLGLAKAEPDAFDYWGLSYYCAFGVGQGGEILPYPFGAQPGPLGYVPWAQGLGVVLDRLVGELPDQRFVVSELGFGGHDDDARSAYLTAAVEEITLSRHNSGADVAGLFVWTGIDNYEWLNGYEVSFGLFDSERRPRGSAHVIRKLLA